MLQEGTSGTPLHKDNGDLGRKKNFIMLILLAVISSNMQVYIDVMMCVCVCKCIRINIIHAG